MYTKIQRGAQSVLHKTSLPRAEADRIGSCIAARLVEADNFEKASQRYQTTDELEIGERAAQEYVKRMLK